MREKIRNVLNVEVEGEDLTTVSDIEFYIRQGNTFFEYVPTVVNANEMVVIIPKKDADQLRANTLSKLQFAYTDKNGNPIASDIVEDYVDQLLKSEGYGNG